MGRDLVNVFVRSGDQVAVVHAAKEVLRPRYDADPMQAIPQGILDMFPANPEELLIPTFAQLGRGAHGAPDAKLFLISPSTNGWVGIYDSMMLSQDEELCAGVVRELSGFLKATAICFVVYDSDVLRYWLATNGDLIDEYNSMKGYFEVDPDYVGPSGGDAEILAGACGIPDKAKELALLLSEPNHDAFGQLASLAALLGIVDVAVDFERLRFAAPKQIGFTVPEHELDIARREQFVIVTKKDLNS